MRKINVHRINNYLIMAIAWKKLAPSAQELKRLLIDYLFRIELNLDQNVQNIHRQKTLFIFKFQS